MTSPTPALTSYFGPVFHEKLSDLLDPETIESGDGNRMGSQCGTVIFEGSRFAMHRDRWVLGIEDRTGERAWITREDSPLNFLYGMRWFAETFPAAIDEVCFAQQQQFIKGFLGKVWNHKLVQAHRMTDPVWVARMTSPFRKKLGA